MMILVTGLAFFLQGKRGANADYGDWGRMIYGVAISITPEKHLNKAGEF